MPAADTLLNLNKVNGVWQAPNTLLNKPKDRKAAYEQMYGTGSAAPQYNVSEWNSQGGNTAGEVADPRLTAYQNVYGMTDDQFMADYGDKRNTRILPLEYYNSGYAPLDGFETPYERGFRLNLWSNPDDYRTQWQGVAREVKRRNESKGTGNPFKNPLGIAFAAAPLMLMGASGMLSGALGGTAAPTTAAGTTAAASAPAAASTGLGYTLPGSLTGSLPAATLPGSLTAPLSGVSLGGSLAAPPAALTAGLGAGAGAAASLPYALPGSLTGPLPEMTLPGSLTGSAPSAALPGTLATPPAALTAPIAGGAPASAGVGSTAANLVSSASRMPMSAAAGGYAGTGAAGNLLGATAGKGVLGTVAQWAKNPVIQFLGTNLLGSMAQSGIMKDLSEAQQDSYSAYLNAINPPKSVLDTRYAQLVDQVNRAYPALRDRLDNRLASRGIRGRGTASPVARQERDVQDALNQAYFQIYGNYNVPSQPGPTNYAPSTGQLFMANSANSLATLLPLLQKYFQ